MLGKSCYVVCGDGYDTGCGDSDVVMLGAVLVTGLLKVIAGLRLLL